jgi:hypothetical protein
MQAAAGACIGKRGFAHAAVQIVRTKAEGLHHAVQRGRRADEHEQVASPAAARAVRLPLPARTARLLLWSRTRR